jgi:hypothetical protein
MSNALLKAAFGLKLQHLGLKSEHPESVAQRKVKIWSLFHVCKIGVSETFIYQAFLLANEIYVIFSAQK